MKAIIYTGLSISFEDAKSILDSDNENEIIYKTPIKRGDILKDLKEKPDIIGIIDGIFHSYPAVAHKEILEVINAGVTVAGSSSMGALRASELDSLGMIGIGYVYKQYATGEITSDDDVAVILDGETLEQLSTPLVSIDYTLKDAVKNEIIIDSEKADILKIAKSTYYPERKIDEIIKKTDLDSNKKEKLLDFFKISPDIKNLDAKELLNYIKSWLNERS
ncbi:TfuA-related McrA-glycine thioamidation protein [Methanobrevibacter sp. DSM 116169]|uniref:TfuA-related McrA-glycine thioamidation protein n=1 Tax=Methanobrevibacter sp. DSM 116169 TaxID=3242727 RepID=UPI0038FD2ED2